MVALRRAVGQEPRARGAVASAASCSARWYGVGAGRGRSRGCPAGCRARASPADRGAHPGVGAVAPLVAGHVEARGAAEAVGDDRVEVRRGGWSGEARPWSRAGSMRRMCAVVLTREYVDVPVGERAMRTFVAAPAAPGPVPGRRLLHRHLPAHRVHAALGGAARGLRLPRRRAGDLSPGRAGRARCSASTTTGKVRGQADAEATTAPSSTRTSRRALDWLERALSVASVRPGTARAGISRSGRRSRRR